MMLRGNVDGGPDRKRGTGRGRARLRKADVARSATAAGSGRCRAGSRRGARGGDPGVAPDTRGPSHADAVGLAAVRRIRPAALAQSSSCWTANTAACTRLLRPSLERMFDTWFL